MPEITRFCSFDGDEILVPGTDPATILAAAVAEVDDDEEVLATVDDVRVEWWRTIPCSPTFCDEGPHRIHYIPTRERTRGGFQAAALPVAIRDVEAAP